MNTEPTDKKSSEWREWKLKNTFGSLTIAAIKNPRVEFTNLILLKHFIDDIFENAINHKKSLK